MASWLELGCGQIACCTGEVTEVGKEPLLGWMGVAQGWQQGSLFQVSSHGGGQLRRAVTLELGLRSSSKAAEAMAVPGDW